MTDLVERAIYSVEVAGLDSIDRALEATIDLEAANTKLALSQAAVSKSNENAAQTEEKVTVTVNKQTAARRTTTEQMDRWIASMDRAAKAELLYNNGLEKLNRFQQEHAVGTEKITTAQELLTRRYNEQIAAINKSSGAHNDNQKNIEKSTVSTAQLRFATQNLTFQLNDVATSLAGGASPFRVLGQQAGQFVQVFQQGGGVTAVMNNFKEQLNSVGITASRVAGAAVIGAVVAAITLVINRIEDLKAASRGFTTALGPIASPANVANIHDLSIQLQNLGVGFTAANKAATDLARNPLINPSFGSTSKLVQAGGGIAARMGTSDIVEGIKAITDAAASGSSGLVKLGSDTRSLSAEQVASVLAAQRLEGSYVAVNKAIDFMSKNMEGVREKSLTPMQKATEELNKEWNKLLNSLAESDAFQAAHGWLVTLLTDVTSLIKGDFNISPTSPLGLLLHLLPGGSIISGISNVVSGIRSMGSGSDPNNTGWRESAQQQAGTNYWTPAALDALQRSEGGYSQIHYPTASGAPGGVAKTTGLPSTATGGFGFITETWQKYAKQVPGASQYQYAYQAPPDVQRQVAAITPISNWTGTDASGRPFNATAQQLANQTGMISGSATKLPLSTTLDDANVTAKTPKSIGDVTEALAAQEAQIKKNLAAERLRGSLQQAQIAYDQTLKASLADNIDLTNAQKMAEAAKNEVIAKASIDQAKYNEEQDLTANLATKTAKAYQEGVVPGLQAAAEEQAKLAALQEPSVNVELRKQQILRANATSAISNAASQNAATVSQIKLEENLAKAAGQGTAAYHDQQVVNEAIIKTQDAYNKALATGDTQLIALAKAETETAIAQAKRMDSLKQTAAAQVIANQNIDQTAILQKEIDLQGKTSEEIQYQVSLLKIRQQLQNEFANAEPEARDRFKATSEALARTNLQLAQAQREQQRIDDAFRSIGNTIDQNITKALEDAFNGKKVTDFATTIKNQLGGILAQITSGLFVRPIIGSVLSSFGLTNAAASFGSIGGIIGAVTGGSGNSASATKSSGGIDTGTVLQGGGLLKDLFGKDLFGDTFSGVSDFFSGGLGGIFAHTPTAADFAAGVGPVLEAPGSLFGSASLGGILGGAGLGFGAGTLLNGLLGGNQLTGTAGSGIGSLAGAAIGSAIFPGVGTLLGGLFGGAGGGLLGGLFGQTKKPDNASGGVINLATGAISNVQSSGNRDNDATASKIGTVLSAAVSRALAIPGAILPGGAVSVQAGSRDGIKLSFGGQEFKFKDADSAIAAGLNALRDHLTGVSDTVQKVIHSIGSIEQVDDALAFAAAYEKLTDQANKAFSEVEKDTQTVGPFATAMNQIRDLFDGLRQKAEGFGLSIEPINAALDEATRRLQGDFTKALDDLLSGSKGNDFVTGLESIAKARDQLFSEGDAIGISRESISDKVNTIAYNNAEALLKPLTVQQLNIVVDAMKDTRPEFADMARILIDTATAAQAAADAVAALNFEMQRQGVAYDAQQNFDTASGAGFLAQIRELDKSAKSSLAQLGPLNFAADSYQASLIKETEHKSVLTTLQGLTNDELDRARALLEQLQPGLGAWADEARSLADAATAAAAATAAQAEAQQKANEVLSAQTTIREYLNGLETQQNAFTTPLSRLQASQSQFGTQFASAQGGDIDALRGITTIAQTLLQNVTEFYGSSEQGQILARQVKDSLASLLGTTGTGAAPKTTEDVVAAIVDDTATTASAINNTTALIIDHAIQTSQNIVNQSIVSSGQIVDAARAANNNIVNTTLKTGQDITNASLQGAASIVGTTAAEFQNQTVTLMTGTGTVVASTNATTSAIVISGNTLLNSNFALLDNNVQNAASLINTNKQSALDLIASNDNNSATLQAANAAQVAAQIAGNSANANYLVSKNAEITGGLIAANDNQTGLIIATAQNTTNQSVAVAQQGTASIIAQGAIDAANLAANASASAGGIVANANYKSDQIMATTASLSAQSDAYVKQNTDYANYYADQQLNTTVNGINQNVSAQRETSEVNRAATVASGQAIADRNDAAAGAVIANIAYGTTAAVSANNANTNSVVSTANANAQGIADRNDAAAGAVIANISYGTNAAVNTNNANTNSVVTTANVNAQGLMNATAASGQAIVNALAGVVSNDATVTALYDTARWIVTSIYDADANIANTVSVWSNATLTSIGANFSYLFGHLGNLTQWIVGSLYDIVGAGIEPTIAGWSSAIINSVSGNFNYLYIHLGNLAGWIVNSLYDITNGGINPTIAAWSNLIHSDIVGWSQVLNNTLVGIINQIHNDTDWNNQYIRDYGNQTASYIRDYGNQTANFIATWSQGIINTIGGNTGWEVATQWATSNGEIQNTSNWSNAIIQNQVAWDNANLQEIRIQTNSLLNGNSWAVAANIQTTFAAADSIVGTIGGGTNSLIGSIFAAANTIIAYLAVVSNAQVASTLGAANSIIGGMALIGPTFDRLQGVINAVDNNSNITAGATYAGARDLGNTDNYNTERTLAMLASLAQRLDLIGGVLNGIAGLLDGGFSGVNSRLGTINDNNGKFARDIVNAISRIA